MTKHWCNCSSPSVSVHDLETAHFSDVFLYHVIHHVVVPGHVDALFHGDVQDPTVLGCREEVLGTCPLADAFCRGTLGPLFKQITYFIKANKQIEVQKKKKTCIVTLNTRNDNQTIYCVYICLLATQYLTDIPAC